MIQTYSYGSETWVDIESGTVDEIQKVVEKYRIHPFIAKEMTSATRKPRIEFHDGYIYCILHFPAWKHSHSNELNQEVDFVIGKHLLVTARYDMIDAVHKFGKTLEVKEVLHKDENLSEQYIFLNLLRELYSGISEELAAIEDITEDITSKIFSGKEREMVESISLVTRTLLDFKRTIDLHKDVLESLHRYGKKVFGDEFGDEMERIIADYLKINTSIQSELTMLRELRETNNSLLTTKQNETVKELTVMGFIIVPLSFIAVLFAMRTEGMPFINHPYGFWIVIGIMLTSVAITLTYANHKKWL